MRKVKILATLGPASNDKDTIRELVQAGVNGIRLNFSHGQHEGHKSVYTAVREVAEELNVPIAVVADLQGPKIRVGRLDEPIMLEDGETVFISGEETDEGDGVIPCTYENIAQDVTEGDTILINDGLIELRVEGTDGNRVICRVVEGGEVGERKGINLPGVAISTASITDKDIKDLKFSLNLGVDYIAVSFVRTGAGLHKVKELIAKEGKQVPVIAKIEKPEALENLDEIIDEGFGLMVARGDLAVETSTEQVPIIQKMLIEKTNNRGKQ